jgi:hypothetical protein
MSGSGGSATVAENVVSQCSNGISIGAPAVTIRNNTVVKCTGTGIRWAEFKKRGRADRREGMGGGGADWTRRRPFPLVDYNIVVGNEAGVDLLDEVDVFFINCNDVWGNTVDNWVGLDPTGVNGNFSADPLFCPRVSNTAPLDLRLSSLSPCLPGQHPYGDDCGLIGALDQGCSQVPGADFDEPVPEMRIEPNPTRGVCRIRLGETDPSSVQICIYDVSGRLVCTLEPAEHDPLGQVTWDATDGSGRRVPSGVYFVHLAGTDRHTKRRLVFLR